MRNEYEAVRHTLSHHPSDWTSIDWKKVKKNVRNLRRRIDTATREQRWRTVRNLFRSQDIGGDDGEHELCDRVVNPDRDVWSRYGACSRKSVWHAAHSTPPDTSLEAERVQIELLRQAPPWRKLYMVGQMTQTVRVLAFSGLRQRYPQATAEELYRRFADLWLGSKLAARVYGPPVEQETE